MEDNWKDKSTFKCKTCMWYVPKSDSIGRCRRHAPTIDGFPVVYSTDWCGDHRVDTTAISKIKEGMEEFAPPKGEWPNKFEVEKLQTKLRSSILLYASPIKKPYYPFFSLIDDEEETEMEKFMTKVRAWYWDSGIQDMTFTPTPEGIYVTGKVGYRYVREFEPI